MKLRLSDLRQLISNELNSNSILREGPERLSRKRLNEEVVSPDHEETGASLDNQVDKYLISYEREAKSVKTEGNDIFRRFRAMMLLEADEEEEKEGGMGSGGGDDDEESTPEEAPQKLSVHDIDVEAFAESVARLIENYNNLLEVEKTLIKRSINFIAKNYDSEVVSAFKKTLQSNHSMSTDKSKFDHEDEDFAAPRADFAGPLGG